MNIGVTTQCFTLEKGEQQGDPVSTYLFMLCLEILFTIVKNNENIKSLKILENTMLDTAYADDIIFFLKKFGLIKEMLKKFPYFHLFQI